MAHFNMKDKINTLEKKYTGDLNIAQTYLKEGLSPQPPDFRPDFTFFSKKKHFSLYTYFIITREKQKHCQYRLRNHSQQFWIQTVHIHNLYLRRNPKFLKELIHYLQKKIKSMRTYWQTLGKLAQNEISAKQQRNLFKICYSLQGLILKVSKTSLIGSN